MIIYIYFYSTTVIYFIYYAALKKKKTGPVPSNVHIMSYFTKETGNS